MQIKRRWHPGLALLVLPVGLGLTGLALQRARSPVGSTSTMPHPEPNSLPDITPSCPTPPPSLSFSRRGGQPLGRDRDERNESGSQIPTVYKVLGVKYSGI